MKAIREAVGFEGVLYDARRGIATEMDRAEVDIRKIRDFLGHKDVKTTEGYINKTMEEKAIAVAHPNLGEKQWT
jgi:integrase